MRSFEIDRDRTIVPSNLCEVLTQKPMKICYPEIVSERISTGTLHGEQLVVSGKIGVYSTLSNSTTVWNKRTGWKIPLILINVQY